MEKQTTFWKDKWALRRIHGRYDGLVTMSFWVREEKKLRVARGEGIYDHWVLLRGSAFRQISGIQMPQLKIILQWLILNPFNSMEMALKWERTEKRRPLGDCGWVRREILRPRSVLLKVWYALHTSGDLVKMQVLIQKVWDGAWESELLTCSQKLWVLLARRPHWTGSFHRSRSRRREKGEGSWLQVHSRVSWRVSRAIMSASLGVGLDHQSLVKLPGW